VLPASSGVSGIAPLYRLSYTSLHLWTIDFNEYSALSAYYGWTPEGAVADVLP
jgi:hypothetical protein